MSLVSRASILVVAGSFLAASSDWCGGAAAAADETTAIYRGPRQTVDDPPCIAAIGAGGYAYLLLAKGPEFKRIGPRSRLSVAVGDPPLAENDVLIASERWFTVGSDGRGRAYVAPGTSGSRFEPYGSDHWTIKEGSGLGSWKISDQIDATGLVASFAGRAGAIWAAGYRYDGNRDPRWLVRQRPSGGGWKTVDLQPGYATAIALGSDRTVYVAGRVEDAWVVRRSADGGATWTTTDRFQYQQAVRSIPQAIAADAAGNVRVVGYAEMAGVGPEETESSDAAHWIVRSSDDGGVHFRTADDFTPRKLGVAKADDAALLPSGDTVVIGSAGVPRRRYLRLLRRGESTWRDVPSARGPASQARFAVAPGPDGTVYVAGVVGQARSDQCVIEQIRLPRR